MNTKILASIDFGGGKVHIITALKVYITMSYQEFCDADFLKLFGINGILLLELPHSMPTSTSWSMSQPYTLDQWNEIVSKLAECNVQILLFSQYLTPKNRKLYGVANKTDDRNDALSNLLYFQANPEQLNHCRELGIRHEGQFKKDEARAEAVSTLNESIRKAMFYGYKQDDAITQFIDKHKDKLDSFRLSSAEMRKLFGVNLTPGGKLRAPGSDAYDKEELNIRKRYYWLLCCLMNPKTGELWGFNWKYVKRFLLGCTQWHYRSGVLAAQWKNFWRPFASEQKIKGNKGINEARDISNAEDFRLAMREADALLSQAFQYVRDNILIPNLST